MEQYKIINAELMEQVQKQRLTIGEMLKTEVLLKRQLLEEREMHLAEAQYNENKLKCAIITLLESLDLNLIDIAGKQPPSKVADCERSGPCNGDGGIESIGSRDSHHRRWAISPVQWSRRQSNTNASENHQVIRTTTSTPVNENVIPLRKTPEPRHLIDLQVNQISPNTQEDAVLADDPASHLSMSSNTIFPVHNMYSIIEESDSEEDISSTIDLSETQKPCTANSRMEISPSQVLRDTTNNINNINHSVNLSKTPRILQKKQNQTNIENSDSEEFIKNQESILEQSSQVQCTPSKTSHGIAKVGAKSKIQNNNQELVIQHVRVNVQAKSPILANLPSTFLNSDLTLSPRRSQLNFSIFNGIANRPEDVSTPRRDEPTIKANKMPKAIQTSSTASGSLIRADQSSGNVSEQRRTSRSCRPVSLKEPSCRTKLRNEMQSK